MSNFIALQDLLFNSISGTLLEKGCGVPDCGEERRPEGAGGAAEPVP